MGVPFEGDCPMTAPTTLHFDFSKLAPEPSEPALRSRSRPLERASLLALLAGTALLYLWGLGASGWANDFYSAAVQAGTQSWKAFFFGSLDSGNAITVDKPPLSLWPMELSGRIFGFSSWSMLVPQALEGVAAVWLLHATVKRWFGHWAGLLAGGLLALTPVAVLMFRFNNPDALMVLLMVAAAYCTTRAVERASTRWLLGAGAVMGLSFLAKGLQPFTLLPALAIAYLAAAPTSLRRRMLQLLGAALALVVGAGWWVLAVQLTPAADRPYIGGSGDNSPLGLAFGYNGLSRLSSDAQGGPGGGGGFDGTTGIGRLFNSLNGGQIAWLLPAALIAAVALAVISRRMPRTDHARAAAILWGGWLLVTGAVLSFAGGIIHTYYTVELAPAVAALVAIGAVLLWRARAVLAARVALAAGAILTGTWSYALLHRTPSLHPEVRWLVLVAGFVTASLLLTPSLRRSVAVAAIATGLVTAAGGSAGYALDTASTAHTGSTPTAGPAVAGADGFGGMPGGTRGGTPPSGGNAPGGGTFPGGSAATGSAPNGSAPSGGTFPGGSSSGSTASGGSAPSGRSGSGPGGTSVSSALEKLIKATSTKWAAATVGSQQASSLELSTGKAVIAIGGFTGSDNAPTLAQFEKWVAEGKIRYFVAGGGGMGGGNTGGGNGGAASQISQWVAQHYTATTVGGSTVYDLSKAST
jgi:4-amino-4-deoxy-L-arabinose transferase-like glycosyltransferase